MERPNLNYIKELSGGDQEFEKKIIDIIKKEFPEEKKVFRQNYNSKSFKLAAENVHKLKHKISILGIGKSYDIAVAFEHNLLNGDTHLNQEFESILKTITNYLQQI